MLWYDIHAHVYPDAIAARAVESIGSYYRLDMHCDGTVDTLLTHARAAGISRTLIHSVAITASRVKSINDYIAATVKLHPDELAGFGTLHPDMENAAEEADRMLALGLKGVKLHPDFQHFALDDPKAVDMFRMLADKGLPVLVHTGDAHVDFSSPLRAARLMDSVPDLKILCAHLGGYSQWDEAAKLLAGRPNLWTDCSSSLAFLTPERGAELIRSFGADRVLFGSDYPMWNPEDERKRLEVLPLTDEEKQAVAGENMRSFLPDVF